MNQSYTEKRRYQRYAAKDRVLVMIQPTPAETYHISDISMGGMAFRYLGDKKRYKENFLSGDLVCEENNVVLENLAFEIISDQLLEDSYVPIRRCGVRFKDTLQEQNEILKKIVSQCSVANLD